MAADPSAKSTLSEAPESAADSEFLSEAELDSDGRPLVAHRGPRKLEPEVWSPSTEGPVLVRDLVAEARNAPRPIPEPRPQPKPQWQPDAEQEPDQLRSIHWFALGFGALAILEAFVIVGLVITPADRSPFQPSAASSTQAVLDGAAAATDVTAQPELGFLEATSQPAGAQVSIDGTARGETPLIVSLEEGDHDLRITRGRASTEGTIQIVAGETTALAASFEPSASPAPPAGIAAGWVSIDAPVDLQIEENGVLLGTTRASRLMLPAGRHELDLTNRALGIAARISVDIGPGATVSESVTVPNGQLSVNALPWAEVWLDARPLGTTPLANLDVPVGTHEVTWRHPQFGERRQSVTVGLDSPVRLVMDMNDGE